MGMPVTMVMPMVAEAVGMIVVVTIAMGVAVGLAVRLGMGMHFAILLYAPAERDAAVGRRLVGSLTLRPAISLTLRAVAANINH
ncbi:MAG TPA: hypothetical protein VN780_09265 [Candidatus Eisenbacteria bacterium]|jgi:hypothetical protein|nr:hypothetical protein [Candidatus Eisenbacteria bacterium]